jgi:hypothetical protein
MDKNKKVVAPAKRDGDKSKSNKALEKREEIMHKDLDHDGEKGEPLAHRIKVLGKKAAMASEAKDSKKSAKDDKKPAKKAKK